MTVFWYASSAHYHAAILFNAAMFAVASLASQVVLARGYRPLIARNPKHRWLLRTWIVIYAFVGIQMGWTLRPFVGAPDAAGPVLPRRRVRERLRHRRPDDLGNTDPLRRRDDPDTRLRLMTFGIA